MFDFITQIDLKGLFSNQIFVGFFVITLLSFVFYNIKALLNTLKTFFMRFFTVSLYAHSNRHESSFDLLTSWFDEIAENKRVHSLMPKYYENDKPVFEWGDSTFIFFDEMTPIIVSFETHGSDRLSIPQRSVKVTALFTRSEKYFNNLLERKFKETYNKHKNDIFVMSNHGSGFAVNGWTRKNRYDDVILPNEQKDELFKDLNWFFDNSSWYENRNVPHNRGYLFYGPPGTGKTSLAKLITSRYNLDLKIVSLSTVASDDHLADLFQATSDSIVLIEDIDVISKNTHARNSKMRDHSLEKMQPEPNKLESTEENSNLSDMFGPTLSGLLNAIDGIIQSKNRVLIMTSNDPSTLDSALLRPGRIDKKVYLGYVNKEMVKQMFHKFYPDEDLPQIPEFDPDEVCLTPAQLQGIFMENAFDFGEACDRVLEKIEAPKVGEKRLAAVE